MSIASPLGAYIPGAGPLHRLRPGAKLLGLFVFATTVVVLRGTLPTAIALGVAILLAVLAGLSGRDFWRVLRGFALVAVPLFAFQAWQQGWERGFEVVGDLFALILAASAVTASTAVDGTARHRCLGAPTAAPIGRPPRAGRVRVFPGDPCGAEHLGDRTGDPGGGTCARAGAQRPRARLVPMVLRSVAQAQLTGEALTARGIGDEER